jgi:molecular chaperone Hsp33
MDDHAAKGVVVRALVAGRAARLLLAEARPLAERTRTIHGLGPDAARLGGEAIVAGLLSSAQIKGEEQLTVQLQGERPRCSVYVDVTAQGALRARITPADLHLTDQLRGMILVIKHSPGGEVYRGVSSIDGASLERALGAHFNTSTQVDAVLRLGCTLGDDEQVVRAGGLLLERLPASGDLPSLTPEEFRDRFGWVRDADIGQLLTQAAFGALGDERIEVLERTEVRWQCRCSPRKIEETLASLGAEQLEVLIREDHGAEVSCNFCGSVYRLDEDQLRAVLASVESGPDTRG